MKKDWNRRDFLKTGGAVAASTLMVGDTRVHAMATDNDLTPPVPHSVNDYINLALIGAGGRGQDDTHSAVQVPGVKLVAVADLYEGRRQHCKEVWGKDVFTTDDYREILARRDIDAVLIATPDHWHMQAATDAMNAGKDVYLEKPMIHLFSDGPKIIETAQRNQRILQVGSQRVSSMLYIKAKELLASGAIGKLNMVTAWWDRNSAIGAWEYSIPTDASPTTIDWNRFLGTAPHIPYNPAHFFRWRCWKAYGSGVAGDLFVHLFSGTHFVTGSKGPRRVMATGGLRYWKDGRDVPDVLLGLCDYSDDDFSLNLRVNFVDGGQESEGLVFTGSEGTMTIGWDGVTVTRVPRPKAPGYTISTFTTAEQAAFLKQYYEKYPPAHPTGSPAVREEKYVAPAGYNDTYDHCVSFFNAVRNRQPVVENPVFGMRAAGPALLNNSSYETGKVMEWDPVSMKILNA